MLLPPTTRAAAGDGSLMPYAEYVLPESGAVGKWRILCQVSAYTKARAP
jgi:hypothetical protein